LHAKAKKAYHQSRADKFYDARPVLPRGDRYLNVLRSDNENAKGFSVGHYYFRREDGIAGAVSSQAKQLERR